MNGKASVPTPALAPATRAGPKLDPALEKYAKMLKMRVPKPAVMNKMKKDKIDPARINEVSKSLRDIFKAFGYQMMLSKISFLKL